MALVRVFVRYETLANGRFILRTEAGAALGNPKGYAHICYASRAAAKLINGRGGDNANLPAGFDFGFYVTADCPYIMPPAPVAAEPAPVEIPAPAPAPAPARLSLASVRRDLAPLGVKIERTPYDEYRVAFAKSDRESSAYFTADLQDALDTGRRMAAEGDKSTGPDDSRSETLDAAEELDAEAADRAEVTSEPAEAGFRVCEQPEPRAVASHGSQYGLIRGRTHDTLEEAERAASRLVSRHGGTFMVWAAGADGLPLRHVSSIGPGGIFFPPPTAEELQTGRERFVAAWRQLKAERAEPAPASLADLRRAMAAGIHRAERLRDLDAAPAEPAPVDVETPAGRFRVMLANGKAQTVARMHPNGPGLDYPVSQIDPFGSHMAAARHAESDAAGLPRDPEPDAFGLRVASNRGEAAGRADAMAEFRGAMKAAADHGEADSLPHYLAFVRAYLDAVSAW